MEVYVVEIKSEDYGEDNSRGSKYCGYMERRVSGEDRYIGKRFIGLSEVKLQFWDGKEEELMKYLSHQGSMEGENLVLNEISIEARGRR